MKMRYLLVATAVLGLAAGCSGGMKGMDHSAPSVSAGAGHNAADVKFAQQMIPHHQQAVAMATLAETRAADPELRKLAAAIKGAQDPEIVTMKGWLTGWGQPTGGHEGHVMPGMLSAEELAKLSGASGVEFDKLFANGMVVHHKGAIEMAKTEQADGEDGAAKALAAAIERGQAAEVEQLRAVLARL